VTLSWPKFIANCKSSFATIGRSLFLGRQRLREKVEQLQQQIEQSEREAKAARAETERQAARVAELEQELKQAKAKPTVVVLPEDRPLPHHQFGARMISLCVNLARRVGLRPTEAVLKIFSRGWASN